MRDDFTQERDSGQTKANDNDREIERTVGMPLKPQRRIGVSVRSRNNCLDKVNDYASVEANEMGQRGWCAGQFITGGSGWETEGK